MRKIFLLIVMFVASSCFAQELIRQSTGGLTWMNVLTEAQANNRGIKIAEETVSQSKYQYYKTYTNYLPQLLANANKSTADSYAYAYSINGSLSLFNGLNGIYDVQSKSTDFKISEQKYKRALSDLSYNLRNSFLELLYAQEMVELSKQILKRRNENYELVRFKYESGSEDKGALLKAEADKIQAENDLVKAQRNIKTTSFQLQREMGRKEFEVLSVTGSFIVENASEENFSYEKALAEMPEYIIAEYGLHKAEIGVKSTNSQFYPDISITANTSFSGTDQSQANGWDSSLKLNVSYPLFTSGKRYLDKKTSDLSLSIAEKTYQDTKNQLAIKIQSAYNDYLSALENLKVREKYVQASEEQSVITVTKYVNGLASYYDWANVENDYINSRKSILSAKKDALVSELYFKNVLGAEK